MAPETNARQSHPAQHAPSAPSQPQSPSASRMSRRASRNLQQPYHSPVLSGSEQSSSVPLRHPRPWTTAELYLECEREQEAVVNRLTRELTALRAQSASVASSHSSNSGSMLPVDVSDPNPTHQMMGATHPTPSRRHRSSSSLSTRSIPTPSTGMSVASSTFLPVQHQQGNPSSMPIGGVSQASANRAAAAMGLSQSVSGASTPARQSLDMTRHNSNTTTHTLPLRPPSSREASHTAPSSASSTSAQAGTPVPHRLPSPAQPLSVSHAMQHYVETSAYRSEMEIVKAENEALRQRVRALECALRTRRRDSSQSDAPRPSEPYSRSARDSVELRPNHSGVVSPAGIAAWDVGVGGVAGPRERSESQSTSASSRRALGLAEDEVRVGESASGIGVGRVG